MQPEWTAVPAVRSRPRERGAGAGPSVRLGL